MSKLLFRRCLWNLVAVAVLWCTPAWAGYLTIGGQGEFTTTISATELTIKGSYRITNTGDEVAYRVAPSFDLAHFSYTGQPKDIEVQGSAVWEFTETVSLPPGGLSRGAYPLLIRRHYEDANAARYSVADIAVITLGALTEAEKGATLTPLLSATVTCTGNGQKFNCTSSILNAKNRLLNVRATPFTSMELKALTQPTQLTVPASGESTWEFAVQNFRALPGSGYAVFALFEWEDEGIHYTHRINTVVNVRTVSYVSLYFIGSGILFVLASIALYVVVFRGSRHR